MRLLLDILISAVFAIFSALVGFVIGVCLACLLAPVIFRVFFPDSDSPVLGLIPLLIVVVPTLLGGVFGFPLCGIWLDQHRQSKLQQSSNEDLSPAELLRLPGAPDCGDPGASPAASSQNALVAG
jgi:hypothetical protein